MKWRRASYPALALITFIAVSFVAASPGEDRAVAALAKLGSKIIRDENRPGQPVVCIYLNGPNVTDAVMKQLASLTDLEKIDMRRAAVTDAGCKDLAKLTQLRELYMLGTPLTNAGLYDLARLKNLRKVYLIGARITDAGLKNLSSLKYLQELNVSDTPVTASGARALQKSLPNCHVIR